MSPVPRCHFDRGKIFYPLVVQYVTALGSFKELLGHGFVKLARDVARHEGLGLDEALARNPSLAEHLPTDVASHRERFEVLPALNLRTTSDEPIGVDIEAISSELVERHPYHLHHWSQSAMTLLIAAWERCKAARKTRKDPAWEFLRHCRNASAHGNRFTFKGREPTRPAAWRKLEIVRPLQGTALFKEKQDCPSFLEPGDPVLLLWDLEQAYPDLTVQGDSAIEGSTTGRAIRSSSRRR